MNTDGVESFAYNWCLQLKDWYDIELLYQDGNPNQLARFRKIVKCVKYDKNKTYDCDILIRNSVWGIIPENINAKEDIYEMKHANYKYLLDTGRLYQQYHPWDKVTKHIACGEFVKRSVKEAINVDCIVMKNILAPKLSTNHVYKLITCSRLDGEKGWGRMQKMADMMRNAGIKFEWNIFTNSPQKCDYEEIHFMKPRFDIWDYLADADYTVLLSDTERATLHCTRKSTIRYAMYSYRCWWMHRTDKTQRKWLCSTIRHEF